MGRKRLSDTVSETLKRRREMERIRVQTRRANEKLNARDNQLKRERRSKKRKSPNNTTTSVDSKRPCLDGRPTTSHDQLESTESVNLGSMLSVQLPLSGWEKMKAQFFKAVSDGPIHQCNCCDRIWYQTSTVKMPISKIRSYMPEDLISEIFSDQILELATFCKTCYTYIRKGTIPPLAVSYGFKYPPQPPCLSQLNDLEERLVALRIPFMQIRELGSTRQYGCKGSVVNVPIYLEQTVTHLPQNFQDSHTILTKLKRRMGFKSHYMIKLINPNKVFEAADYLQKTPLYQSQAIEFDSDWLRKFAPEFLQHDGVFDLCGDESEEVDEDSDDECTTLAETVIVADSRKEVKGLELAPGENQTPISLLFDELGDELSYPKIYCGQVRFFTRPKPPSYFEIVKSELRRYDRRGATPQKVLYSYIKVTQQQLLSSVSIALRNKIVMEDNITVENARNAEFIQSLKFQDLAYKYMRTIKSSPEHWANERRRVLAQIRQFGTPTLFLTVSAAECQWYDLIKLLVHLHEHRDLTEEEFKPMSSYDKIQLIRNDPVICCMYFYNKTNELFKVLKKLCGPLGSYKISHYYIRTEFQQRGSPHYHILLYLEGAPSFEQNNESELVTFVDELMSCSLNHPFAHLQRHKHTFTCHRKKGNDEYCRFNIPFFPMDKTRVLFPFTEEDKRKNKENYKKIRERLEELEDNPSNMSFQEFLSDLTMELDDYLNGIRSGITRPTVVLKRQVNEILINPYNPKILELMQSNMDLQFVLDQYAVVAYLVDYVGKSSAGLSKQMRECIEATKKGNLSLKEGLRTVSNVFLNGREVSAQEAAWSLLEFPMSKMSEDDIFIPTFPSEKRSHFIKSEHDLMELESSSTDIFESSLLDKYVNRPESLQNVCLADFAALYEFKKTGDADMMTGKQYLHKRAHPKVIRFCNFKKSHDEDEFYREQIMLYFPWRNEKEDIQDKNKAEQYQSFLETILENRKKYVFNDNVDWDEEMMAIQRENDDEESETTPNQYVQFEKQLDYDENEAFNVDIKLDMDAAKGKEFAIFRPPNLWTEKKLCGEFRKANSKQRDLIIHFQHHLRFEKHPIFWFIQGAAGTGKSFTISILEQIANRVFQRESQDPNHPIVMKMAPTGKAAANISGMTLHSALGLSLNTAKCDKLSSSTQNEYCVKFQNCRLIIIDEISMVGQNLFNTVSTRLKDIMNVDSPFGNLHVILLGDLRQLPPVQDTPLYKKRQCADLRQLADNLFDSVQFYELTEIMRQKDDQEYAMLLNHLADGNINDREIEFLKSKVTPSDNIPHTTPLLFYSNKEVDKANQQRLNSLKTDLIQCLAFDSVSGSGSHAQKKRMLDKAKTLPRNKTGNLSYNLQLKKGARYMLTYNVDTLDGLVNGAIGILKDVEMCPIQNSEKMGVKRVWLDFIEGQHVGKEKRQQCYKYAIRNKMDHRWTPIDRYKKVIQTTRNGALSTTRNQIPLIVSEAMTVHKSQGATFDECAVGCTPIMTRPCLYVALSRVKSAKNLYIINDFYPPKKPDVNDPILTAFARLKQNTIIPQFYFLHERSEPFGLQVMYHNVQSLNAHYEDILADPCFMNSDVLLFSETWTIAKDTILFPDFLPPFTIISGTKTRKPSGVSIYVKKSLYDNVIAHKHYPNYDTGVHISFIYLKRYRIGVLYAKPQSSVDDILDAINSSFEEFDGETILCGDFNIRMDSNDGLELRDILDNVYYLQMRSNPTQFTTKGKTTIDAIFASKHLICCGVYESLYSYHLPMYARCN